MLVESIGIKRDIYHCNEGMRIHRVEVFVAVYRIEACASAGQENRQGHYAVTTHTPVPAGHDYFSESCDRTTFSLCRRLDLSWTNSGPGTFLSGNSSEKFLMSVWLPDFRSR
jgi:hypothetical protein